MKWIIIQLIVVNNNLRSSPILAASCTKEQPAFFRLCFKYICWDVKKFIFCLPVIVLFDDKFETDRDFTAAVRRAFLDTLLSNLDESKEPTKVQKEIIYKLHQKIQQKNNKVKHGIFFRKAGGWRLWGVRKGSSRHKEEISSIHVAALKLMLNQPWGKAW